MVTLLYSGSGAPSHMRGGMDFGGLVQFKDGERTEVSEELAGQIVAHFGPGSSCPVVEVVSGQPQPFAEGALPLRDQIRRTEERASVLKSDPARALAGLVAITEALRKLAVADVEAGKADARLADLAIYWTWAGQPDHAKAAARRCERLRVGLEKPAKGA